MRPAHRCVSAAATRADGSAPARRARSAITRGADGLIVPHGGKLVDLLVTEPKQKAALYAECQGRTIELSDRNACDVELLTVGCAAACAAAGGAARCCGGRG